MKSSQKKLYKPVAVISDNNNLESFTCIEQIFNPNSYYRDKEVEVYEIKLIPLGKFKRTIGFEKIGDVENESID